MLDLGRIEPPSNSTGIDRTRWVALIDAHPSLAHVPPRIGPKPGTQELCEYKAPASTAIVFVNGARAGSIEWALDGSPYLLVHAQEESARDVAEIAEEVATILGARFILDTNDEQD
jgi:hypothetical protein